MGQDSDDRKGGCMLGKIDVNTKHAEQADREEENVNSNVPREFGTLLSFSISQLGLVASTIPGVSTSSRPPLAAYIVLV